MHFILHYAIPVFNGIMQEQYFKHLLLLIIPMEHLLSKKIEKKQLKEIHQSLCKFVSQIELYYDIHLLKSASHELIHLAMCTETLGPINDNNCYQFEELNRKVMRFIKGEDLLGDEFIKLFNCSRNFSLFVNTLNTHDEGNKFIKFIKQNYFIKSSNKKKTNENTKCNIKGGKTLKVNLNDYLKEFIREKIHVIDDLVFYEYIYYNDIMFSIRRETKFSNHTISLQDQFGVIQFIIKTNDSFFFICADLVKSLSPFYIQLRENIKLKSKFSFYSKSCTYFLIHQDQFQFLIKHFMFIDDNGYYMVTSFNGDHLFS